MDKCGIGKLSGTDCGSVTVKGNMITEYQLLSHCNALVSGKPRTPIPGECGALAGDFSGFGLSLLPRYAGFSTAFGASIGELGP